MTKTVTILVCVGTAAGLIAWDLYVGTNNIKGDTISEVIWSVASQHPLVPFLCGLVAGHLFWRS